MAVFSTKPCDRRFLDEAVTPRFPGFTIIEATGSWKGAAEPSTLLAIAHCGGRAALDGIDAIGTEYARRFRQEAVGRIDQTVCQNFCSMP